MSKVPVVALASGTGTLFQALLDAAADPDYPVRIAALLVDQECGAAERAAAAGIPVRVVSPADHRDRGAWDQALTAIAAEYEPQWLVSVGFMRILGPAFLAAFPQRILNTHPSLLPAFPGATPVADAVDYGVKVTGCTVHVVDEGVDSGPVVAQQPVAVGDADTADTLHERIKIVERQLIVDVLDQVTREGLQITGRKAVIP